MHQNQTSDEVELLSAQLEAAKANVRRWQEVAATLSRGAAEARAKSQGMGRGLGGALFGAKYRAIARRAAAAANAEIAKEVATNRASIAKGKRESQELVRRIQAALLIAKQQQKRLAASNRSAASERKSKISATSRNLTLLEKLKEAHTLGLLTDEEFERKRRKLVEAL